MLALRVFGGKQRHPMWREPEGCGLVQEAGLELRVEHWGEEGGQRVPGPHLGQGVHPRGHHRGLKSPDELVLVSFDLLGIAPPNRPDLTHVVGQHPRERLPEVLVQVHYLFVHGPEAGHISGGDAHACAAVGHGRDAPHRPHHLAQPHQVHAVPPPQQRPAAQRRGAHGSARGRRESAGVVSDHCEVVDGVEEHDPAGDLRGVGPEGQHHIHGPDGDRVAVDQHQPEV
mmetsp:Transcript_16023/g.50380  ORF Transcript_16023/g.50380 Transcript_16023/m.50380 type:complete len:228 (-) Transcript_16023:132-815(-)